jgi:deoxyribodipyrimidine photo-lyase
MLLLARNSNNLRNSLKSYVFLAKFYHKHRKMTDFKPNRVAILWFRNDLRLNDNFALKYAAELLSNKKVDQIVPFYCFDKELFEGVARQTKLARVGPFRRNFHIESVENLKDNLKNKLNSNLKISYGQQDEELINLIDEIKQVDSNTTVESVIASKEVASEEIDLEDKISKLLKNKGVQVAFVWDITMIHLDDLPYHNNISKVPDVFTFFRKNVETGGDSTCDVRKPADIPTNFKTFDKLLDWGHSKIPSKASIVEKNVSAIQGMKGGELEALARTTNYFFKTNGLSIYKTTRNGLVGTEYSSKLSMWLALGCVSARYLYWKVKEFESKNKPNESTKAFVFELLWRDFFKFHSLKYGKSLFYPNGCSGSPKYKWKSDKQLFEKWCKGETGYPFVDANMKELNETGWMSNRGRQNVASFLTKDLEIDWRWGAEYFETMLIDYDCTSNWGNWQYVAGVGTDPRADRYFNVIKQAYDYDENGEYVKMWLPQLAKCELKYLNCPFKMSMIEQQRVNCVIGKNYPAPVVRLKMDWDPNRPRSVNKFAAKSKRNN